MGRMILPKSTIGIVGGGQLGKMLAQAAQMLGYKVVIWSEEEDCPACRVTASTIIGPYTDKDKLEEFTKQVDVATVETEHIHLSVLQGIERQIPLYPSAEIVGIAQNRQKEKSWLAEHHFPVVPFQIAYSIEEIILFKKQIDADVVVKTITGGYDGKGQLRLSRTDIDQEQRSTLSKWLSSEDGLIVEAWLPIQAELSVIAARNIDKNIASFPVVENEHRNHILHQTIAPARIEKKATDQARQITETLMEELDYVGLLCVEFFYDQEGKIYINELAPRPHNSGHYTLNAAVTSQFEQTVRAICNLPLGETSLLSPSVMVNLLGELWPINVEKVVSEPEVKLHLYGKKEAREKRKMGHYTILADSIEKAMDKADSIYISLLESQH